MRRLLPPEAFAFYLNLGVGRSYEAVAKHFNVSKRAVVKRGVREHWQEKVVELEQKARAAAEQKACENMEAMNERHLKSLRVIQGKALEALRAMPLDSAINAVRSLDLAIRQERLIRGEPTDRPAIDLERMVRDKFSRWLVNDTGDAGNVDSVPDGKPADPPMENGNPGASA